MVIVSDLWLRCGADSAGGDDGWGAGDGEGFVARKVRRASDAAASGTLEGSGRVLWGRQAEHDDEARLGEVRIRRRVSD